MCPEVDSVRSGRSGELDFCLGDRAYGDEPFELFKAESDASPDADRDQLIGPDELVDRRSAHAKDLGCLGHVDEERSWGRR